MPSIGDYYQEGKSMIKNSKGLYVGLAVLLVLVFVCGIVGGAGVTATVDPEVTRIVEIPEEITRIVEKPYETLVEVTRIVEVPIEVEVEVPVEVTRIVEVTRLVEAEPPTPEGMSVSDYTDVILITIEDMAEGLGEIGNLMLTASDLPSVIFENWWKDELLNAADKLTMGCLSIYELEAPPIMTKHHDYLLLACEDLDGAAFEVATFALLPSMDAVGIGRLTRATELMTSGADYIGLATAALP